MTKKIFSLVLTFCIAFTGIPLAAGSLNANAASQYWKNMKASATGQTSVSLSWNKLSKKQQKKVKGITIFRDGVAVKNLKKSAASYTDTGLKSGTTYKYQVKTYKTKTTKLWLNKKTGQYQKKKPAKKYRGKSKKVTTYSYANASPAATVTTQSPPLAAPSLTASASSPTDVVLKWNAVSGATSYNVYRDGNKIASVNATSYTDKVSPGTAHSYVVEATNGKTASSSAHVAVQTPAVDNSAEIKKKIAELDKKIADVNSKISAKNSEKTSAESELSSAQTAYNNVGRQFINSKSSGSTVTRPYTNAKEAGRSIEFFVEHCKTDSYLSSRIALDNDYYERLNRRLSVQNIRTAIRDIKDMNAFRQSEGVAPLKVSYELMAFAAVSGNSGKNVTIGHIYYGHQPWPETAGSEMLADSSANYKSWIAPTLLAEKQDVNSGTIDLYETHYGDAIKSQWKSIGATYIDGKGGINCVAYSESEGNVDINTYEREFESFVKDTETRYNNAKNKVSTITTDINNLNKEKSSLETQRNELAKQL